MASLDTTRASGDTDRASGSGSRSAYGAAALLATAAGVAAGHLTAAVVAPASAPLFAVGSTVIDLTPTPVKEWAVAHFGTADKPILVGSVLAIALGLATAAGVVARAHRVRGLIALAVLTLLAGGAALTRPAADPVDALAGVMTGIVGVLAAGLLFASLDRSSPRAGRAPAGRVRARAGADPAALGMPGRAPHAPGQADRRAVLVTAAGVGAVAVTSGTAARVLTSRAQEPSLALPAPATPAGPAASGLEGTVPGISPFRTPNADFYRVDTALVVPRVSASDWSLRIDGEVDRPYTLTYEDLLRMPLVEADITLTCVSNEVGGGYVGGARWLGVRTRDLLERAGVRAGADQVFSHSIEGMTISTPIAALTDDRLALVALGMNGVPLPRAHGFPARLVTPGLYGFVGATKWLTRLEVTRYAARQAYWTERGWATDAPILTQARIDTPRGLSRIPAGRTVIGGVAWAQHRGIRSVEVRIDDGRWQTATLGPSAGIDYWRQWYLPWDAPPGQHTLVARATDLSGTTQPEERTTPFPRGATGWPSVVLTVE